MDTVKLSERLRDLRTVMNVSQQQLGDTIGLTKSSICKIESGIRATSINNLIKIADYFDVSVDYLLGRTDNSCINK